MEEEHGASAEGEARERTDQDMAGGGGPEAWEAEPQLPPIHERLIMVFLSPGTLMARLAAEPAWAAALIASLVLIVASIVVIPVDLFMEAQRQAILEAGGDVGDMPQGMADAMRFIIPIGALLSTSIITFLMAGLYTIIFAFILGDEGGYKQYLAVLVHAMFIPAVFSLLVTPLRISTENPQFTVNLAGLFAFLSDGYFLNVLRLLDVSQIWSTLVFAQGVHQIDPRRSFGSAATISFVLLLAFIAVMARFV